MENPANQPAEPPAGAAEAAYLRAIRDHPDGRVAAVMFNGLFCAVPESVPVNGQSILQAKAGIELVDSEYRPLVLEQFRQLSRASCNEVEVRLTDGRMARYALFDLREPHGVVMLLVADLGGTSERADPKPMQGLAPIRPRSGRSRRTAVGEVTEVDAGLLGMLGYTREAFQDLPSTATIHQDDYPAFVGHWFDLLSAEPGSNRRARVRYLRADGSWLWVEITLTREADAAGEPCMLSEVVDISEEMAAIDEVWRSREFLRRLTDGLPVGVLQIDVAGEVRYANDRLHALLGSEARGTVGAPLVQLLDAAVLEDDKASLRELVERAITAGVDGELECRYLRQGSAATRYARVTCRVLHERNNTVAGAVLCVTDETDSTVMRMELENRASFDMLTQCLNRGAVMDAIDLALVEAEAGAALLYIDLDDFKPVNDTLGHAFGDELLRQVAERLKQVVRDRDSLGRLGGDEFVIVCPGVPSQEIAERIGRRVHAALQFDVELDGNEVAVRASVGVAWTNREATADQLVASADAAMYRCKRAAASEPVLVAV